MAQRTYHEPARDIPVAAEVDVLVAGGGPAGLGAAVGAARQGATTLLVEKNAFLGGAASAVMMNTWNVPPDRMSGFTREIAERLIARGEAMRGVTVPFDPEAFKTAALEFIEEAGARLLLYSSVVTPIVEDGAVRGAIVENKSGRQAILANTTVDCTGDADLAARAGAPTVKGRESDGKMRPVTLLFRVGNLDLNAIIEYARAHPGEFTADPNFHILKPEDGLVRISGFFSHANRAREAGELDANTYYIRFEGVQVKRGIATVNTTRVYGIDGTDAWDLTRAELEARRQMGQILAFMRKRLPGCANCFIIDTSANLGVRETRRIRGEALLSEDDILARRTYPDAVVKLWRHHAAGRDWHSPDGGEGSPTNLVYRTLTTTLNWFELPWGVFVPQEVDGLLVAGRTLSVTHEADMWTRGEYACMTTGHIAGTAAAQTAQTSVAPRALDVAALRTRLAAQGVDVPRATA